MSGSVKYRFINYFIASVWMMNGLFCKVFDLVPRHRQIVARILGEEHATVLTLMIGFCEVAMAIWVLTGIASGCSAWIQMLIIGCMNILEFVLVPELLLWGRMNAFFASLFIV